MKSLISLLAISLVFATQVSYAQSEKFAAAMRERIAQLDSARTAQDFQNCANNFERIANAEKAEWLPAYYTAYALCMKAFYDKDVNGIDGSCDKADAMLAQAEALAAANSEIATVKAMLLMARMRVDGSRSMTLGPKATQILQQALQQQPAGNPRALVQMAQMLYYTPPAFGGGKDTAGNLLKKGILAYESFVPASDIHPNWGKAFAQRLQAQWERGGAQ
jgi:hypothetical protein